jgi:hypothetical protein
MRALAYLGADDDVTGETGVTAGDSGVAEGIQLGSNGAQQHDEPHSARKKTGRSRAQGDAREVPEA